MLVVFAFVGFVVWTIRLNEALVTVQFAFFQPVVLELWMVMLAAFGIGAGVILFFDLAGGVRRFAHARRRRRLHEAHQAVEELYMAGLDMVSSVEERALEQDMPKGVQLGFGVAQLSAGGAKEAIAAFRLILADDESFVPAYIRLGEALAANDQTEEAIRTWHRGYELTGSTEPLSSLQNFYLRAEQPEAAIGVWKQALILSENEVPLRYSLGKLHYRLYMLDEALREFQMIEDRVSGLPALHLYVARILESKNELSAALRKTKLLVAEVEGLMMDYVCESCEWRTSEWTERCSRCGHWDTVGLHLPAVDAPEAVIAPSPTWSTP